jgi:hypothetical protein
VTERAVALAYCRGLTDKEVAALLYKSYWTIKTEKKAIYRKLGITKDTELMAAMICDRRGVKFELNELRKRGIELLTDEVPSTIQRSGSEVGDNPTTDE